MKIDNSYKATDSTGTANTNSTSNRPRMEATPKLSRTTNAAAEMDAVKLSPASTALADVSGGAPIDNVRVAEIKQAIAEGRFEINADAIANGLIDSTRNLIQSKHNA